MRDQPAPEPGGAPPKRGVDVIEPPVGGAGRIIRPVRWLQALYAPALLVDQNRRIGAADRITKTVNERAHLVRRADVAIVVSLLAEQDQAPGIGIAQKRALLPGKGQSGEIGDEGFDRHRRGL